MAPPTRLGGGREGTSWAGLLILTIHRGDGCEGYFVSSLLSSVMTLPSFGTGSLMFSFYLDPPGC